MDIHDNDFPSNKTVENALRLSAKTKGENGELKVLFYRALTANRIYEIQQRHLLDLLEKQGFDEKDVL